MKRISEIHITVHTSGHKVYNNKTVMCSKCFDSFSTLYCLPYSLDHMNKI